jgi:hypothetical protein
MHDDLKALNPILNDPFALVVGAMGLWVVVMAGGGAMFALTLWILI